MCETLDVKQSQIKRRKLANLFLVLAIVVGLMLIFMEPPFVCPDENAHFINIARISHGGLFADVNDGKIGSFMTDEEIDFLLRYGGPYNGDNAIQYDLGTMYQLTNREATENLVFFESTFATLNPLPYLLPSLFVFVLRLLGMSINAYNTLMTAKIFNLLLYALVIRWALLKTRVLPKTMFMLGLMPMTIFQGASASYDSPLIACSFLLVAFVSKICYSDEENTVTIEDIIAICIAAAFVVGCKIAYAPLLLVLFAIPIKKFGAVKRYLYCIGFVVASVALTYGLPTIVNSVVTAGCTPPPTDLQIQQLEYVKANPMIFPEVILSTVEEFHIYWLQSFFGILGWLDTFFPDMLIWLFLLSMTICAIIETSSIKGVRWNMRVLSLVGVLIFFVGTLCMMYVQWNPVMSIVGGTIAYGIQGRYFIPIALFVVLAFASPLLLRFRVGAKLQELAENAVPIVSVAYLGLTVIIILVRYWT